MSAVWHVIHKRLARFPHEHEDAFQVAMIEVARAIAIWEPAKGRWFSLAYRVADRAVFHYFDAFSGRGDLRGKAIHLSLQAPLAGDEDGAAFEDLLACESPSPERAFELADMTLVRELLDESASVACDATGQIRAAVDAIVHDVPLAEAARAAGVSPQALNQKWARFKREASAVLAAPIVGKVSGASRIEQKRAAWRRYDAAKRARARGEVGVAA